MSSGPELLAAFLARFEISALGESIGQELAARLEAQEPRAAAAFGPGQLQALLGGAAAEGCARLIAAAELSLAVEGEGPDPSHEALAATVENVRAALSLICPPPGARLSIEERAARSAQAIGILAQLVSSWDRSLEPEPRPEAAGASPEQQAQELAQLAALWEAPPPREHPER